MAADQRTRSNHFTAGQSTNTPCDADSSSVRVLVHVPTTDLSPLYARLPSSFDFMPTNAALAAGEKEGRRTRRCRTLPESTAEQEGGRYTRRCRTPPDAASEEGVL